MSPDDNQGWAVRVGNNGCWTARRFPDDSERPQDELDLLLLLPTGPDPDQRRYLAALSTLRGCIGDSPRAARDSLRTGRSS